MPGSWHLGSSLPNLGRYNHSTSFCRLPKPAGNAAWARSLTAHVCMCVPPHLIPGTPASRMYPLPWLSQGSRPVDNPGLIHQRPTLPQHFRSSSHELPRAPAPKLLLRDGVVNQMEDAHEIHKEVVVCRKHAVNLLLRIDPFKLPEAACFCLVGEGVGKALLLLACEARSSNSAFSGGQPEIGSCVLLQASCSPRGCSR